MRTETEWEQAIRILFHIRNRHDSSQYSLRNFTARDNVQRDRTRTNRSSYFWQQKLSLNFSPCIFISYSHPNAICVFFFWIYIHMMTTSTHAQRSQLLPWSMHRTQMCSQLDTRHVWGLETKALATHTAHTPTRPNKKEWTSEEKNRMRLCECRMLQIANSCFRFI